MIHKQIEFDPPETLIANRVKPNKMESHVK